MLIFKMKFLIFFSFFLLFSHSYFLLFNYLVVWMFLFFFKFLFVKGWIFCSSLCCFRGSWRNCEDSSWTWIQCWSSNHSFDFDFSLFSHFLCSDGYVLRLFLLLKTSSFVKKDGITALHRATFGGFEGVVKVLLEHGSNVDLQTTVSISFFISLFLFYLLRLILGCLWVLCLYYFFF